jgi:hypothetical protein
VAHGRAPGVAPIARRPAPQGRKGPGGRLESDGQPPVSSGIRGELSGAIQPPAPIGGNTSSPCKGRVSRPRRASERAAPLASTGGERSKLRVRADGGLCGKSQGGDQSGRSARALGSGAQRSQTRGHWLRLVLRQRAERVGGHMLARDCGPRSVWLFSTEEPIECSPPGSLAALCGPRPRRVGRLRASAAA